MLQNNWFKYLPDLVSFIVATTLGCVALLPSPSAKKKHPVRIGIIVVLIIAAVCAFSVSIKSKREAEQTASDDKAHAVAREVELQQQLSAMKGVIDDDIRTKEAHPLILAAYGSTGVPEVGQPLGVRLAVLLELRGVACRHSARF